MKLRKMIACLLAIGLALTAAEPAFARGGREDHPKPEKPERPGHK